MNKNQKHPTTQENSSPELQKSEPRKTSGNRSLKVLFAIIVIFFGFIFVVAAQSDSTNTKSASATASTQTPAPASHPTPKPAPKPQPPSCTTYQTISSQAWLEIVKDPSTHADECITVYGEVTQFDAATGTGDFRANVGGVWQAPDYGYVNYPTNTLLTGNAAALASVVQQDLFTANVMVMGSYTYQNQVGGQTTVPQLHVNSIKVTGTASS